MTDPAAVELLDAALLARKRLRCKLWEAHKRRRATPYSYRRAYQEGRAAGLASAVRLLTHHVIRDGDQSADEAQTSNTEDT